MCNYFNSAIWQLCVEPFPFSLSSSVFNGGGLVDVKGEKGRARDSFRINCFVVKTFMALAG